VLETAVGSLELVQVSIKSAFLSQIPTPKQLIKVA
jgi:hypothetical protein